MPQLDVMEYVDPVVNVVPLPPGAYDALKAYEAETEYDADTINPLMLLDEIYEAVWAVVINTDADIQEELMAINGTKLIEVAMDDVAEYEADTTDNATDDVIGYVEAVIKVVPLPPGAYDAEIEYDAELIIPLIFDADI